MQIQPTSPRADAQTATQVEHNINFHIADRLTDSHLGQPLDPALASVLERVLSALDHTNQPLRMGFFAPRAADRTALLDALTRSTANRRVRTPEHRKVVSLRIDATTLPEGTQPWHHLVMSMVTLLTEGAMPGERATLNELRNDLGKLIRLSKRDQAGAAQSAAAFVKRFQAAFPKLVLNTISLANAVLLIVLEHVEDSPAGDAVQWLEATQYFCSVPGCAVLLATNEPALIERLGRDADGNPTDTDSRRVLRSWVTLRPDPQPTSTPAPSHESATRHTTQTLSVAKAEARAEIPADIPAPCAHIIKDAFQPDAVAIEKACTLWRAAMQAVVRRAEERLGGNISAVFVAKLVALRGLAPDLHDAARYDAQMLPALERAARGAHSATYDDWAQRISQQPKLKALFTSEPSFASADLRDLAAALRLTNTDSLSAAPTADAPASTLTLLEPPARQRTLQTTELALVAPVIDGGTPPRAQTVEPSGSTERRASEQGGLLISTSIMTTGFVAASVFLLDRIAKLFIQSTWQPSQPLLGGFIQPEFLSAQAITGDALGSGLVMGAELIGLALAVLIAVFWGGARQQRSHSVSLGCIIGALGSNLFDQLAYGAVFNYLHVANLPTFSLAHAALLLGALLLAYSLLRSPHVSNAPAANHSQAGADG